MNWKSINTRTKVFIGLAFTYILSVNVPDIKNVVIPKLANHPHISTTLAGILFIVSLLQNPMVQEVLGIKHDEIIQQTADGQTKVTQTTTVVPIDPSTTVDASSTTVKS